MSELKPCPFCGVVPAFERRTDSPPYTENNVLVAFIACGNSACMVRPSIACYGEWGMPKTGQLTNGEAKDQVTYAWNTRAGDAK